ncbi:MAG: phosphate signaling complex protein PhoU [candidate division Zixibacteria bacterium]|nr:phosphate signaling complex protein PhoU [candidate division Zixibacteria bacterium]
MPRHFQRELERLKRKLLGLSALVGENLRDAIKAVGEYDLVLADKVREVDLEIDQIEIDVEEDCLKILALHQPVAIDLRLIVAILKINNDLERIGDLSENIARQVNHGPIIVNDSPSLEIHGMDKKVQRMLNDALDAFVNLDVELAREVCINDDQVDEINARIHQESKEAITADNSNTEYALQLLSISRYLERIADHTTNIAEDVIYLVEGEIIRHGRDNTVDSEIDPRVPSSRR